MAPLPPAWPEFMATVEGRESPQSCVLVEGLPVISFERVPQGAAPNLTMLVSFLRSDRLIPPEVRAWLADMLDGSADTFLRLSATKRKGRPARAIDAGWEAVEFFHRACEVTHRKQALFDTMKKFGIKRAALEAMIVQRRAAEDEAIRVEREGAAD